MKQDVRDVFGSVAGIAAVIPMPCWEAYNPLLQRWQCTFTQVCKLATFLRSVFFLP